jgi:tight adherence protein C
MSPTVIGLIIIGIVILAIAITLIIVGIRNPESSDNRILQARLDDLAASDPEITLEKIELSQPLRDRVIFPAARKLGEFAVKFTPQNALHATSRKLELAGSPAGLDPTLFLALQFISFAIFAGFFIFIFSLSNIKWSISVRVLIIIFGSLIGFYFPQLWLGSAINRRQKNIRKALPDALDLLTICVEAGLGFDAALAKVAEKWETELSLSFARAIREMQLGKLRKEALRTMADRIGIAEMTSFVAAVIQSEQLGVSMAKVLRIQSDQMRLKRRQFAEEEAHKAPIKMLLPMGLLIFPSLLIVLMTPAGFRIFNSTLGQTFK